MNILKGDLMRINAIALQAAALAAVLLTAGAAAAETSPLGLWIDHTGRGAVEITECGGKLCGHIAWLKDGKNASSCGEQVIGDVKSVGGGKWDNGWIYDPDAESKYDVELTPLDGDKLRVVGYAGSKWLSETMTWKRAPADLQKCSKTAKAAEAPASKDNPATVATAPAPAQADTPSAKGDAQGTTKDKTEDKTATKSESKSDAAIAPTDESDETADSADEDADETHEKKTDKHGKAMAKIAEALDVKKISGRKCQMNVPYVDMVVTFPCDK
jgi:uncharacterized protein (DUF2147 family)